MAVSDIIGPDRIYSGSTSSIPRETTSIGDWLATPGAISSVRRMRKTVTEQSLHKKIFRKASSDSQTSFDSVTEGHSGSRGSPSRNTSLRERHGTNSEQGKTPPSPRKNLNPVRTSSLREWKMNSSAEIEPIKLNPKIFTRSYSMLTKGSIADIDSSPKLNIRPKSEKFNVSSEAQVKKRTTSKRGEKLILSRKSSNESTGSFEGLSSPRGRLRHLSSRSGLSDDVMNDDVFKIWVCLPIYHVVLMWRICWCVSKVRPVVLTFSHVTITDVRLLLMRV